jgi:hypothetical protein
VTMVCCQLLPRRCADPLLWQTQFTFRMKLVDRLRVEMITVHVVCNMEEYGRRIYRRRRCDWSIDDLHRSCSQSQ